MIKSSNLGNGTKINGVGLLNLLPIWIYINFQIFYLLVIID